MDDGWKELTYCIYTYIYIHTYVYIFVHKHQMYYICLLYYWMLQVKVQANIIVCYSNYSDLSFQPSSVGRCNVIWWSRRVIEQWTTNSPARITFRNHIHHQSHWNMWTLVKGGGHVRFGGSKNDPFFVWLHEVDIPKMQNPCFIYLIPVPKWSFFSVDGDDSSLFCVWHLKQYSMCLCRVAVAVALVISQIKLHNTWHPTHQPCHSANGWWFRCILHQEPHSVDFIVSDLPFLNRCDFDFQDVAGRIIMV